MRYIKNDVTKRYENNSTKINVAKNTLTYLKRTPINLAFFAAGPSLELFSSTPLKIVTLLLCAVLYSVKLSRADSSCGSPKRARPVKLATSSGRWSSAGMACGRSRIIYCLVEAPKDIVESAKQRLIS